MTRLHAALAIVAVATPISLGSGAAGGGASRHALDGMSFDGRIRGTGLLRVLSADATLSFEAGVFRWSGGEDFAPAPYEAVGESGSLVFTARATARAESAFAGDVVDWRGVYDGASLRDVSARWQRRRGEGHWLHDLLLPGVVRFAFEPRPGPRR